LSHSATSKRTQFVRDLAVKYGFDQCGFSESRRLTEEEPRLESWLTNGYHGKMAYMENHFDKRLDPTRLVEGSKSVISLTFNYFPEKKQREDAPKIAKYAYGEDYHFVLKDKLKSMAAEMTQAFGDFNARVFVDSAPVLERAWAAHAGLGWIGKHSLLLSKQRGSFVFLAQIISDLEFDYDGPTTDHCGSCTACIDACPTDAIVADRVIDANRCISYLTIELKNAIDEQYKSSMENWAFGCDICQDVCPWNRFSKPHQETRFNDRPQLLEMSAEDWEEITEDVFRDLFKKSAVKRTGFSGFLRNLQFLK
jgi:epoxyqueuosine reductase